MGIDDYLNAYSERFGDGFPMIPLGWGRTDAEIIKIISKCLKLNEDVYEMGIVDEGDIEY